MGNLTTEKNNNKTKINLLFILILGLLSMLPPLGIDMYLPAFLHISQDLNVPAEQVQYTLTMFTFGMGIGQLLWGPVADSLGRKPIILLGLVISTLAAFFLTQVMEINSFIGLRFIQGFFGAAPVVVLGALLRDLFSKDDFSRMMSMIVLVLMVAPLLAPVIGGHIVEYFNWHVIFYLLVLAGIVSGSLFMWYIPETHKKENRIPFRWQMILRQFWSILKRKDILGYLLVAMFSFAGLFAFLTSGSIVYINLYGISVDRFGYFFMMNVTVLIIFTMINGKFVGKFGAERMMQLGLTIQALAGIWLFLVALLDLGFWPMAIGVAVFIGMNSMIGSNSAALILEHFPKAAGTANSVLGTLRFTGGAIVGSLLALIPVTSATPMLITMTLCVTMAVVGYLVLTYPTSKK